MKYIYFLALSVISVSNGFRRNIIMKIDNYNAQRVINEKQYLLPQESYNNLLKRIDNNDISAVYISNKLDAVLTQKNDGDEVGDFAFTTINPYVVDSLSEKSTKHNIETIFLKDTSSYNSFQQPLKDFYSIIDNFIIPSILISVVISFIRGFFISQNGSGATGGFPGLPRMPGNRKINDDKINRPLQLSINIYLLKKQRYASLKPILAN